MAPWLVVTAFYLRWVLLSLMPEFRWGERLWLTWLGDRILETGTIPTVLGAETLSAAGQPWIPQEWLFAVGMAAADRCHVAALFFALLALIAIIPLALLVSELREAKIGALQTSIAVFYLGFGLDIMYQVRANVVALSVFGVALFLLRRNGKTLYTFPLLVALLANIHASALLLALMPFVVFPACILKERGMGVRSRRVALVALPSLAASLCTPFGTRLWQYAFTLLHSEAHRHVVEWQPLWNHFDPLANTIWMTCGVGAGLSALMIRRDRTIDPIEASLMIFFLTLTLCAQRFSPYFALAVAPSAFRSGNAWGVASDLERLPSAAREFGLLTPALFALLLLYMPLVRLALPRSFDPSLGAWTPQAWRMPVLIGNPKRERVYCSDFSDCNAYLRAGAAVFTDGRFDPYPTEVWQTVASIESQGPGYARLLARSCVNVVVTEPGSRLAIALGNGGAWQPAFADEDQAIFVPKSPVCSR